jgi:Domain of unknown function (DUF4328)/Protein of unknown function (DUF2510)
VSDTPSGYPGAPPGWYADPASGPGQRWWDGYAWTDATILPQPPQPPPMPGNQGGATPWASPPVTPWAVASDRLATYNTTGLVAAETGMAPVARIAIAMPAIYFLVHLLAQRIDATQLLATGRALRRAYEAAQHGQSAPAITTQSSLAPLTLLVTVIALAAVVLACIWQHRAASAARALGLPATHSPGWGVGSWFVPVVNFWMPYQAIRDCLPPDDDRRAAVLRWWLVLIATWVLCLTSEIVSYFSRGGGLAFALPAGVLCLALLATAPRVVTSIADAHRDGLLAQSAATSFTR